MIETKEQCEDMLSRVQDILRDDGRRVLVDRLYEVRTFITTLTRENERLLEWIHNECHWEHPDEAYIECLCCNNRAYSKEDIKHAPDCLAFGGER